MKGSLPFIRRKLLPCYFILTSLIFLIHINIVEAKTVVIGSGFGYITVPNMNGLNPGDVLAITAGQYSGASFSNLKGITITNNGSAVVFTGKVMLNTLVECVFSGFQFRNVNGTSIRWVGNSRRCTEKNISFMYCTGITNDANDNNIYNGDTSSLKLYMCTFDSLTLFSSGIVLRGSYGDAKDGGCYMDSIVLSRIKVDSTLGSGLEVGGVIFRIHVHDWKETYKGTITLGGDVGIFQIYGNGSLHNIYRTGGRGYIARIWNVSLKVPGNTYYYNNIDLNTYQYGSIDTKIDQTQFVKYVTGANCFVFNNTVGNKQEHIGYWSSVAVVGDYPSPWVCQIRNNLGFNLQTNGKPPITANQSNGSWQSDSSNDMYFDKPDGVIDPVTCIPVANSPVLGKGLSLNLVQDDYYHNPRIGAYDIGAVQHGGAAIPPPANQPPVAIGDAARTITLPASNILLDGTKSYDPDGTITSYLWTNISGSGAVITSPSSASTTVKGLTKGISIFKLTVTDNNNATASVLDTIVVNSATNLPPIANAGADQTIVQPVSTVTVNGSGSKDQDDGGALAGYHWSQSSGPASATIVSSDSVVTVISGLKPGVYVFKLTVTDSSGATSTDSMTVVVKDAVNQPPVAKAGASQTITLPLDSVTLDGSQSSDPDGSIVSYNWAQVSGPSTAVISNSSAAQAMANGLVAGQYIFEITVTDNSNAVSKAQVKITVTSSGIQPPTANAGANQTIQLPTNQVNLDGSASVAPSGTIVAYTWSQISGPSTSTLSSANSAKTNATGLVKGVYIFKLTVQDSNNVNSSDSVTITVNPAANLAPVANAGPAITLILPANAAILDGSKSSDADGTISSYQWVKISGPQNPVMVGADSAILSLSGLVAGVYVYQLTVTDNNGATGNAQVKITVVAPPNILPVANAGTDQTITAPANAVNLNGTSSYDPDGNITAYAWVLTSGHGAVTISNANSANASVSGLTPGIYTFQLTVTDNDGATSTDAVSITVLPEPILPNQSPVANAGPNQVISEPTSSTTLNGSSSFDPDGTINQFSWTEVSGPSTAGMTNDNTTTPTVTGLIVGTYVFQLIVTDNNGASGVDQVTIQVNPEVNKINLAPVAIAGSDTTIYLPSSGYMLNASASYDPDGNITSYQWKEISGPNTEAASSMIGPQVDITNLEEGIYQFQLTVTDNQGATSSAIIKIAVDKGFGSADQIIVFPNPAHDILNSRITSAVNGTVHMVIYDMNGKIVMNNEAEKQTDQLEKSLNVSGLSSGMYLIQVNIANRKTLVTKFIKR